MTSLLAIYMYNSLSPTLSPGTGLHKFADDCLVCHPIQNFQDQRYAEPSNGGCASVRPSLKSVMRTTGGIHRQYFSPRGRSHLDQGQESNASGLQNNGHFENFNIS